MPLNPDHNSVGNELKKLTWFACKGKPNSWHAMINTARNLKPRTNQEATIRNPSSDIVLNKPQVEASWLA